MSESYQSLLLQPLYCTQVRDSSREKFIMRIYWIKHHVNRERECHTSHCMVCYIILFPSVHNITHPQKSFFFLSFFSFYSWDGSNGGGKILCKHWKKKVSMKKQKKMKEISFRLLNEYKQKVTVFFFSHIFLALLQMLHLAHSMIWIFYDWRNSKNN